MTYLPDFLLARIAEDEAVARAAEPGPWRNADGNVYGDGVRSNEPIAVGPWSGDVGLSAEHIARHDPARVLVECKAKRRIVERMAALGAHFAHTGRQMPDMASALLVDGFLADLALPYADHPDYRQEWKP